MKNIFFLTVLFLITSLLIGITGCGEEEAKPTTVATPTATETPTLNPTPTNIEARQAKIGDTVKVHYTGSLGNGTIFDSSVGGEPLQFTLGEGRVIEGFEKGVLGLAIGESKTVVIPSNEAYGPYREELIDVVDRDAFPEDWEPEIGKQYQFSRADGGIAVVKVIEITESTVTIDYNHPLVGKDLTFDIELVEIVQ